MKSLPDRNDPQLPEALRAAREAKKMTYSELARAIGISVVMPSRYENKKNVLFSTPSLDTWRKLNNFFFGSEEVELSRTNSENLLSKFSVDELISEIKRRGATAVQISF